MTTDPAEWHVPPRPEAPPQGAVRELSKDDILGAKDNALVPVHVPEWGGQVFVRPMSGSDRDHWEQRFQEDGPRLATDPKDNVRASLLALCVVDSEGNRLFTSEEDVDALGKKALRPITRLYDAIVKANSLSATDIEDLEGN